LGATITTAGATRKHAFVFSRLLFHTRRSHSERETASSCGASDHGVAMLLQYVAGSILCPTREATMLSARNQFAGTVKSVKLGNVMAEVVVQVDNLEFVSAITRGSVDAMALKPGDAVRVVVKSTEVMIDK